MMQLYHGTWAKASTPPLRHVRPSLPFVVAGPIGLAGTSLFTPTVPARDAA
jgi:hypothetical protein